MRIKPLLIRQVLIRNPIHYELTTGLSGRNHTEFYCNALLRAGKVPEVTSVDMAGGHVEMLPRAYTRMGCFLHAFTPMPLRLLERGEGDREGGLRKTTSKSPLMSLGFAITHFIILYPRGTQW